MTPQEMAKLRVIDQTIAKTITVREAAELLNLSERQVLRLKKGVSEQGAAFVIHKNRGRKPEHTISGSIRERIVELKQSETYQDANFTHFQELIKKHEGICVSYPTVYRALSEAGITSPKKKGKRKVHHRRKRKPQEGMLVQIDASPHPWFFGEEKCSLHGAIDDATGKVLGLHFEKNECLVGYFEVVEQIITCSGIPISIYSDRHTIFRSPKDGKLSIEEQLQGKQINLTQFGRAMSELGVRVIFAKSPQAKGRIEKLWDTLQSRLPIEFKIRGITTMQAANAFLHDEYIDEFNELFSVEPEDPQSAFRQLDDDVDLNAILCVKEKRVVSDGSGFSYGGQYYQLIKDGKKVSILHKTKITVLDNHKSDLRVIYNNEIYETELLAERPRRKSVEKRNNKTNNRVPVRPADDHPWRMPKQKAPRLYYDESDREILEALFNSSRAWT